MIQINPAFCFKPTDLIGYLRTSPKETTLAEEIAAAITHRLIMEEELGWKNYAIYFEPKDSRQKELLEQVGTTLTFAELEPFVKKYAEEGTPVDYAFVNMDTKPADVYPVQHKRYYPKHGDENLESKAFIDMLDKWRAQYSPTETSMLVHYKGDIRNIDLDPVMDNLHSNGFPFREVMILLMTENGPIFMQIYPNSGDKKMGYNTYSVERMQSTSKT